MTDWSLGPRLPRRRGPTALFDPRPRARVAGLQRTGVFACQL